MQCDLCDSWVHITCNNLNLYTYRKLQKGKSPWYCMYCFWKELPDESINDTKLRDLLHGEAIVSPNPKLISSIIKQSEYFDERILKRANYYTPDEFNTALESFNLASQLFCMHLNIFSLSYHHYELYNLLSNLKIKPNIIWISETRLLKREATNNQYFSSKLYLWTYLNWSRKRRNTFIYWQKHKIQAA